MKIWICVLALAAGLAVGSLAQGAGSPPAVCISAVGPVDQNGLGDTTPALECR